MTEIRVYFEGNKSLREGFLKFLKEIRDKARAKRIGFELIACGATPAADFRDAGLKHPTAWNVLLIDSEGQSFDDTPSETKFWMVELMEAWFLADPDALETYYRDGFKRNSLKPNPRVEEIPKADVMLSLLKATRGTQKGPYHKTKHAPNILGLIDPIKVRHSAPNCERLFATIAAKLE